MKEMKNILVATLISTDSAISGLFSRLRFLGVIIASSAMLMACQSENFVEISGVVTCNSGDLVRENTVFVPFDTAKMGRKKGIRPMYQMDDNNNWVLINPNAAVTHLGRFKIDYPRGWMPDLGQAKSSEQTIEHPLREEIEIAILLNPNRGEFISLTKVDITEQDNFIDIGNIQINNTVLCAEAPSQNM